MESKKKTIAAQPERLQRVESLLRLYPDIEDAERGEILHYLRRGPILDRGLLTGMETVRPQLARFRADHRKALGLQPRDYAAIGLVIVLVVALCALLWDAGLP